MRHNLDGLSKIVAAALLLNDVQVDFACGDVVFASKAHREIPLVVAKIEINLAAYILSAF
jgi:iron-sulfur cluster repair protein YtfE (RIC family)